MPHIFGFSFGSSGSGSLTPEQEAKIAGIPAGGTTGQVLTKKSNASYDDEWATSAGGPPSGAAGGDLEGSTYPNPVIKAEGVGSSKIEKLAVTGAKIAKETIAGEKLIPETITATQLGGESVTTAKVKLLAITAGLLGAEAVETAKIKLLAITEGLLASEAVSAAKIKVATITETQLASALLGPAANVFGLRKLGSGALEAMPGNQKTSTAMIEAEAVTEEKLAKALQETIKAAKSFSHTFAVAGKVEVKEYPGFFVPANEPNLLKAEYELLKGTSCKFELLKNKEAIAEYTALEAVKTEKKVTTKTKALTAGWWITLKVTEITGTPEDLSVTVSGE
jgi:hypothetical protein